MDIADDYRYMDPQLVALTDVEVTPFLTTDSHTE